MASEIYATIQSTGEIRTHFVDFTEDLPSAVTVSSGTATLTSYPTGGTATVASGVVAANVIPVTVTSPTLAGNYYVDVTATLSNGDKSVARLIVPVIWSSVRTDMADLIVRLRGLTDTGVNDYTIGGNSYWSDRHLQDALDKHATIYDFEELDQLEERSGSVYLWKRYPSGIQDWQGQPQVMNENGGTITSGYSFDAPTGLVTFTANQQGSARYISGTAYDLNGAAAEVWRMKAGHYASHYDFQTDGHNLRRSQLMAQAAQMASYYEGLAGPNDVEIFRSDCTGGEDWG